MATKKLASYVGETYESTDPRDEQRRIRIVDVVGEALRYRRLQESTVSPGTQVPTGRKGIVSPATLKKAYQKVGS